MTQTTNTIVTDERSGKPMLLNEITVEILAQDTSFAWWYNSGFENYETDDSLLSSINLDGINIVVVLGTWCGDSRTQFPRFMKILNKLNYDKKSLRVIAVDRKKKAESVSVEEFNIEKVPTFIFYKDNKELGRIIETPVTTLERDISIILHQNLK